MMLRLVLIAGLLALQGCTAFNTPRPTYFLEHRVRPVAETAPVISPGDSADDPAIWINPDDPAASLIIGTDKRSGLYVYGLDGAERQYLPLGNTNNVDLRQAPWGNDALTLVAASGRFPSELILLSLDHRGGKLRFEKRLTVDLGEPYGICLYKDANQQPYVFLNSTDGTFAQYAVSPEYEVAEVRRFKMRTQVEGCVVNDDEGVIYISEEGRGIWRMPANADAPEHRDLLDGIYNRHLVPDIEGLALYDGPRKLLIASSQGDNSYSVYDTETSEHLLSFHIEGDANLDGTTDTDGIDITAVSLPGYPRGMLVVQDGENTQPAENQNFKIVSWGDVLDMIEQQQSASSR